jgi:hypothetical protein
MLNKDCFTIEWINKVRDDNPPADPIIVEKTIFAFELLALLSKSGLEFIFKGGTSLLLHFSNPKRLSIDIDISTSSTNSDIETILNDIVKNSAFSSWEENPRIASKVPKKHYKLFYNSVIESNNRSYILLDVLFQQNPYPVTLEKEIVNKFIKLDESILCTIPSPESILGDKLTAYAPHTTGVPFGIGKDMQIQKQLFDIGELFNIVTNIEEIKKSFNKFVEIEAGYRETSFSTDEVAVDITKTSFLLSQILLRKSIINEEIKELQSGITKLRSHLIGINYNLEAAKLNAAKAAFTVAAFNSKIHFGNDKIYNIEKISSESIKGEFEKLERLKNFLPEAYYYWQKINEMSKKK